jgi:CxxC-x17-CxxC domain-containing protein
MGNFRFDNRTRFGDRPSRDRPRNNRFGGGSRSGFGRDRDSRMSERRPREMHDVVCDKCGKQCQVPFRPSGDKPVLCSDCFGKNKGPTSTFSSRNQDTPSEQSGVSSEQLDQINAKLDKILLVLQDLELEVEDDDFDEEEDEEALEEDGEGLDKKNSKTKSK